MRIHEGEFVPSLGNPQNYEALGTDKEGWLADQKREM